MTDFSLWLFSVDPACIRVAVRAGVAGIVVDWESTGKIRRQAGADTEINHQTPEDLRRVRAATAGPVLCRINGLHDDSAAEIDRAIALGADELLLPMVGSPRDVERALDLVGGRRPLGILIETGRAVRSAGDLCALPLSRVYVGLNDLAIDRGSSNIFQAVADGTVEGVRRTCARPFGFGGLTLPDAGAPIPCHLLIGEMARISAGFSFLRRSFFRDIVGRSLDVEVPRLLEAIGSAQERSVGEVLRDHTEFLSAVAAWVPAAQPVTAAALDCGGAA
jgi:hypothetical protein